MADEVEQDRRALTVKLQAEIDRLKEELRECQEDADEQRSRGQSQRIQLLDEVSDLRQCEACEAVLMCTAQLAPG